MTHPDATALAATMTALLTASTTDADAVWATSTSAAVFVGGCSLREADVVMAWLLEHPTWGADSSRARSNIYSAYALRADVRPERVWPLLRELLVTVHAGRRLLQCDPALRSRYVDQIVTGHDWDLLSHCGIGQLSPEQAIAIADVLHAATEADGDASAGAREVFAALVVSRDSSALSEWFAATVRDPRLAALRPAWVTDPSTARSALAHVDLNSVGVDAVLPLVPLVPDEGPWQRLLDEPEQYLRSPYLRARAEVGLVPVRELKVDDIFMDVYSDGSWEPRLDLSPNLWQRVASELTDPTDGLLVLLRLLRDLTPGKYGSVGALMDVVDTASSDTIASPLRRVCAP